MCASHCRADMEGSLKFSSFLFTTALHTPMQWAMQSDRILESRIQHAQYRICRIQLFYFPPAATYQLLCVPWENTLCLWTCKPTPSPSTVNHCVFMPVSSWCKKILWVHFNKTAIKKHKGYVAFWESYRFGSRVDTLLWRVTVSEYKTVSALPYSPAWQHGSYANTSRHRIIWNAKMQETLMICAVWESWCSIRGWDERFKDE